MSKLLGVTVVVEISRIGGMTPPEGKKYALGARSDDFKDGPQFERAVQALCSSLDYSVSRLVAGKEIDDIAHPFFKRQE